MSGLLKFITCGSVDDGKSTLIGHILYDSKLLYADQEKALELDSKVGSRGGAIDYSLLLDGLMAEREQGITMDWIRQQVKVGLQNVTADQAKTMVIAYEPIWAIGTGKTATSEQAQEICKGIRECVAEIYDTDTAEAIRIQYGGSVNAGNAAELFAKPDIDGGLVGGASLKADFGKIVNYK